MMDFLLQYFPEQAGLLSAEVDAIYIFMLAVSLFFTVLVVALSVIFSIQYRKRNEKMPEAIHGNLVLELTWTGIPLLLTLFMFAWGTAVYIKQVRIPENAKEIFVVGKQWMWKIQHGEGPREMNELHVPINQPIKLTMTSEDVIHSFYIPAMRMKQDTVPGRYSFMWFQATKPGKYHIFCAEYCGTKHSGMIGSLYAMEPADYQKWLDERIKNPLEPVANQPASSSSVESPVVHGEKLFTELKCITCHSQTSGAMGPDLAGLFGRDVKLEDGRTVPADETYLRHSIINPADGIVQGYSALMPTYKGQVSEEQLLSLVAYIKSLQSKKN
ncbi:MAG TPA: cytochrome c oxidase subunit II [Candidatus Omnitrophota bacterium]|nr:cytochrome c oxidase subunit II [Candidatus Omnitrophota bacterium]HRK61030.1 cytochrome c oxidase subunit II [Candidatus Omnitrophota bacterium]